jgi:hypothetical protein
MSKEIKIHLIFMLVEILIFFSFSAFLVSAWTDPSQSPPLCPAGDQGCDEPLTISSTGQIKSGALGVSTDGFDPTFGLTVGNSGNQLGIKTTGDSNLEKNLTIGGNLGVGTASPSQQIHVHSGGTWSGTRVTTAVTGSTVNDGVNFGYDNSYGAYIWNREASNIVFSTNNTERARFNSNGNLGIGSTNPANAKLHVETASGPAIYIMQKGSPSAELKVQYSVTGNGYYAVYAP